MKSEIIIVVSHEELFINGAQLILEQVQMASFGCRVMFIEDWFFKYGEEYHNNEKKLFYFLTNVDGVMACVHDVLRNRHIVINKTFLLGENSKLYLQKAIEQEGIVVPKSVCPADSAESKNTCKINFPCYVKSQKHTSTVVRVANKRELNEVICLLDCNNEDWYLEEAIEKDGLLLQKAYYVGGKIFVKDSGCRLENVFGSISKALDLEVFSVDIFSSKSDEYCVIDVNPAPSFFKSKKARKAFATFLIKKINLV